MDVRRYADLFLTESRDHLTAFNHFLLEWERDPAAPEPVGGIFRRREETRMMVLECDGVNVAVISSERISLEAIQAEPAHG